MTYSFYSDTYVSADKVLPTNITLDINDGQWPHDVLDQIEPDYQMTINAFNDLDAEGFILFEPLTSGLRWHYKLFLRYDEFLDVYKIVYTDPYNAAIDHLDLPNYDYIVGVHYHNTIIGSNEDLQSIFDNDGVGRSVVFDQDLTSYTGGDLVMSVHSLLPSISDFSRLVTEEITLPIPALNEYEFLGWTDGINVYETFSPFKAQEHINQVTLSALWGGYTPQQLLTYLDTKIPSYVNKNIVLPTKYSHFTITWETSNAEVISDTGKFMTSYSDKKITLTANISNESGVNMTEDFVVDVEHKKSLTAPIASSYIYRGFELVDAAFFNTLDIINVAFIDADEFGNLSGFKTLDNVAKHIMPQAKAKGNWVIMSIAPSSSWSSIAISQSKIDNFADEIVRVINENGFDGVDIDWEFPRVGEEERFVSLIKAVHTKVKANNHNHLVTAAIAGGIWQAPNYKLAKSGQYLDYVNLMTYGLTYNGGNYQNPLRYSGTFDNPANRAGRVLTSTSIVESIAQFNGYGIPNSKIIVGLAFYGVQQSRTYNSSTNTFSAWERVGTSGSIQYPDIINLVNNPNYTVYYDTNAGVPYILKNDGTLFVSYDNPKSIREKANYVRAQSLAGLMFWEYGTDTTGTLLEAMGTALEK